MCNSEIFILLLPSELYSKTVAPAWIFIDEWILIDKLNAKTYVEILYGVFIWFCTTVDINDIGNIKRIKLYALDLAVFRVTPLFYNDRTQRPIFWESQFYYNVKKVKEG